MSVNERDPYTGHKITGHIWNGIKELNSPVPLIWYISFAVAFVFSVGYWIYMPAWPSIRSYSKGLSGFDQRDELGRQLLAANLQTETWRNKLVSTPFEEISLSQEMMAAVMRSGPTLYKDNCAGCHGVSGEGATNYPPLNDSEWLWKSGPDSIYQTLKYGINSGHAQSRQSNMPAFADSGRLNSSQISDVSLYVQSLSNTAIGDGRRVAELISVDNGRQIFTAQCSACHGADGKGNSLLGAPNLTDAAWIYGSDTESLNNTISNGRAGHMPAWIDRMDDTKLRILALYVSVLSRDTEIGEMTEARSVAKDE